MQKSKSKIVFCITNDPVTDRRMTRICEAVSEFGNDVLLIGVERKREINYSKSKFEIFKVKPFFKKSFLFYLEFNLRLFFILVSKKFDILNAADIDTIPACKLISILKNKKLVFDAHEYFSEVPELNGKWLKKNIWKLIEKITLPYISNNYTVSQSLSEIYSKKTKQKYDVIRNLPSSIEYQNLDEAKLIDKKILLYIGALNVGRGLENMVQVLKNLPNEFQLLIIGGGPKQDELKIKIKELNIENRIELTGWLHPKLIPQRLKGSFIGFNLLEDNSINYHVSLANKIFDYIHLGIPCISVDFIEYKRLNEAFNCLYLIENIEIETIINAILRLDSDKLLYSKLIDNNLKAAKILNWENEKLKLKEFY